MCIKRGIRTTIAELLSLSDEQIRFQLQSAIWGQIFRRPNIAGFPSDPAANNNYMPPHLPVRNPTFPSLDGRAPDADAWRLPLQAIFDDHSAVEHREEGQIMIDHVRASLVRHIVRQCRHSSPLLSSQSCPH